MESIASKSVRGIFWSAVEKFSLQGVQFVISIILARLLTPTDFGIIGMLSVFLSISVTFIDCGFSSALIRQKDVSKSDYGTAFLVNLSISILAFLILFATAPLIANFYNMPELKSVTRVVSVTLIINALFTVHKVKLTRNIDFKKQSYASLFSAIISGILGITFAYNGFGVWSLVYQSICNSVLTLICMCILLKWFPIPILNINSFKNLFDFGSKIFISSLIHTIYSNLYNIVIGKQFSASALGFYTRANHFVSLPITNITGILSRVTYPILAQLQNETERLKSIYLKYLSITCLAVFPLMTGLMALAKPLVFILIGNKWESCVILLQILCFGMMLDPICTINLNLLYVKGRSDLVLKLEIIKKTIAITILIISLPFGLIGLCIGRAIYGVIATFLNMRYTRNFINLSIWQQTKMLLPMYILSLFMGGICFLINLTNLNDICKLILGTIIGMTIYISLAYIFKIEAFFNLLKIVKKYLKKQKS